MFKKKFFLFLTIIATVLCIVGCTNNGEGVVRFNFEQAKFEVRMHEELELKPVVKASNKIEISDEDIVYQSLDETIARYVDGVVIPVSMGTTKVQAYYNNDPEVCATALITVKKAKIASIEIVESMQLLKGAKQQIAYELVNNYSETKAVFSVEANSVLTVTEEGLVSAKSVGEATIKVVVSDAEESYERSVNVKVVESDFAISYDTDGGVLPEGAAEGYSALELPTLLPVPTKVGYEFKGWMLGEEVVKELPASTYGDVSVKAVWETVNYEIKYSDEAEGNPATYTIDDEIVLVNPSKAGYEFKGWTLNGKPITEIKKGTTGDLELLANFEVITYTISYSDEVEGNPATYTIEDEVVLVDAYKENHTFKGWTLNGEVITKIAKGTTGDLSLVANFEINKYKISYDVAGGTLPEDAVTEYEKGVGLAVLPIPTKPTFIFKGWTLNGETVASIDTNASGDITLVATWESDEIEGYLYVGEYRKYATLEDALKDAKANDVIFLTAGNHVGTTVEVDGITIIGPNAGINPVSETRKEEAVISNGLTIKANNVTIDGIKLTASGKISLAKAQSVENVTITNVLISETTITGQSDAPLYFYTTESSVEFKNVVIKNVLNIDAKGDRPMILYASHINGITIKDSKFVGNYSLYNDGMKFDNTASWGVKGDVNIINNHIEGYQQYPIWFRQYGEGTYNILNNTFVHNGISESSHAAASFISYVGAAGGTSHINFQYNTVNNSYMAVRIDKTNNRTAENQTVKINYNKVLNSKATYHVKNSCGYTVDATNNWYDVTPTSAKFVGATWEPFTSDESSVPVVAGISYELNGGQLSKDAPIVFDKKAGLSELPTPTKEGYIFLNWELDGEKVTSIPANTESDVVLIAKWREDALYVSHNGEEYAYITIAEALAAAQEGDKIIVLAGEWSEKVVITVNNLTFVGVNQGINPVTEERNEETVFLGDIIIKANDVTINGIQLTGKGRIIASEQSIENLKILNVKVYASNINDENVSTNAPLYFASTDENVEFKNIVIVNMLNTDTVEKRPMILYGTHINGLTIKGSKFVGKYINYNDGIKLDNNANWAIKGNLNIIGNYFEGYQQYVLWVKQYGEGTYNVLNNTFVQNGTTAGSHAAATFISYVGAADGTSHINFQYNTVNNSYMAFRIDNTANRTAENQTIKINYNKVLNCAATYYVKNSCGYTVDATNNWYDKAPTSAKFVGATWETYFAEEFEVPAYGQDLSMKNIRWVLDGGEFTDDAPTMFDTNTGLDVLPTPTKSGYEFKGWELNGQVITSIPAGSNAVSLTAKWEALGVVVTLEFELNGGNWEYQSFDDISLDLLKDYNAYRGTSYTQENLPFDSWVEISVHTFFYSKGMKEKWSWLAEWLSVNGGSANKAACAALLTSEDADSFAAKNKDYKYAVSYEFRAIMRGIQFTSNSNFKTSDYSAAELREKVWDTYLPTVSNTLETVEGKNLTLPTPKKPYLSFVGWYDNPEFTGEALTEITVSEDVTKYYAKFVDLNPVTNVNITNSVTTAKRFATLQLEWEVLPSTTMNKKVKFVSSDTKVATVDAYGLVQFLTEGTVTIKVVSLAKDTVYGEMVVTVYTPEHIQGEFVTDSYVVVNETIELDATLVNGTGDIEWKSLNSDIASVEDGVVKGLKAGTATIVASKVGDESIKFEFIVIVIESEEEGVAKFLREQNNANIFLRSQLGIGAGGYAYYADILSSVSKLYFAEYVVDTQYYIDEGTTKQMNNCLGVRTGALEFITVHYTGNMSATAGGKANASYFNDNSYNVSINYVTGNDGIFYVYDEKYNCKHAGDGTSRTFEWHATNVMVSDTDPERPVVTITANSKFAINGTETIISCPTGYAKVYDPVTKTMYEDTSNLIVPTDSKYLTNLGPAVKVVDGQYYIGSTWWCNSQVSEGRVCSTGGNLNSIGIESACNEGSDLWMTWQKTAQLVSTLMIKYNLDIERVKGHNFFSAKDCPQPMLENDDEIWWEFIDLVKAEYEARTSYKDWSFTMVSDNQDIVDNTGRVINQPEYDTCVTYTVTATNGDQTKTIKLSSIVPGMYRNLAQGER